MCFINFYSVHAESRTIKQKDFWSRKGISGGGVSLYPPLRNQTAGCVILCFSHVYWHPYASAEGVLPSQHPSLFQLSALTCLCVCQDDQSPRELSVSSTDSLIKILPSVCAFRSLFLYLFSLSESLASLGCPYTVCLNGHIECESQGPVALTWRGRIFM